MELQSVFKGWDSLDRLYGRCLNRFGEKRTSGLWDRTQGAEAALFLQEEGDLMFKSVWGIKVSCFRFNAMSRTCFKCLLSLVITDVQVFLILASFLYFKQKYQVVQDRHVRAIFQLSLFDLSPSSLWILFAVQDLVQGSRDEIWHKASFDKNGNVAFLLFLD